MLKIQYDKDLSKHNTFGVACIAEEFIEITSVDEVQQAINTEKPLMVLGGGSNMLLPERMEKRVLFNRISGIETVDKVDQRIRVRVGGGVNWHSLVTWAVEKELGGIENLALIPGTVGAAPIQNIGAYGVELKDVFASLEACHLSTGRMRSFSCTECQFGYRNSVFKNELKGEYFITHVELLLTPAETHTVNTSYKSLEHELDIRGVTQPDLRDIYDAVIHVRQSKLPDPSQIGNSGSFFKNSIVDKTTFDLLLSRFPDLIYYPLEDGQFKIPTGWLIEKAGWKGKRVGNVGCYSKQALVLVNHGGGTSTEVHQLADQIQKDVMQMFGIKIEPEVNVL